MSAIEQKEDWLLARQGGIGGTDAAAICGLSPWKRPIDVFLAKTEPLEIEPPNSAMWWGSYLEGGVRKRYTEETGLKVSHGKWMAPMFAERAIPFGVNTIVRGNEGWQLATPDGIVKGAGKGLEIKTSSQKSPEWGAAGTDEVPTHYLIQCAWLMAVTAIPVWDLAALFRGNDLQVYTMRRDPDLESSVLERCRAFWHENVLQQVAPDVDESESYGRYLARKFSLSNGAMIEPTPEIEALAQVLRSASVVIDLAESQKREACNKLMAALGENAGCKTSLGKVAWVRPKARKTVDWESLAAANPEVQRFIGRYTTERPSQPYVRGWFGKGDE